MARCRKDGFTLLELLVVIAIIGLLAGVLLSALARVKNGAKWRQAEATKRILEGAIWRYKVQFHEWPMADGVYSNGITPTNDNRVVISNLVNADPPCLVMADVVTNGGGFIVSPWGDPYVISLSEESFSVSVVTK